MRKVVVLIIGLFCLWSSMAAKSQTINRPKFAAWNSSTLEIEKVVLTDTATIICFKTFGQPHSRVQIAKGSFLKDEQEMLYPVRYGVGIELDIPFVIPSSGEATFELHFPPIHSPTATVDFQEGSENGLHIWGIELVKQKPPVLSYPIERCKKNQILELPVTKHGKATLRGKVLELPRDMRHQGTLQLYDAVRGVQKTTVHLNAQGEFEVELELATVTPSLLILPFGEISCFLAPDKVTEVVVNTRECCRRQSQLHRSDKAYGRGVYYWGYLAGIQQELEQDRDRLDFSLCSPEFIAASDLQNADEIKSYLLDLRDEYRLQIEKSSLCLAAKEIQTITVDIKLSLCLIRTKEILMTLYLKNQRIDREEAEGHLRTMTIKLPTHFYDCLSQFSTLNSPKAFYALPYGEACQLYAGIEPEWAKILNTTDGTLFEVLAMRRLFTPLAEGIPFTEQQQALLEKSTLTAYVEMFQALNRKVKDRLEEFRKKEKTVIVEVPQISGKELLPAILAPYRGEVVLVDFWATWCAPCRMANQVIQTLKKELYQQPVVYLYITGETSPEEVWVEMIKTVHGNHYRLTKEQWQELITLYGIKGIPTYFIITPEGELHYRKTGFPGIDVMRAKLSEVIR
ncbi:MAG: TlpA family protein disulfide reductase [Bacteroidia bacterium]|nr:TlpA family protein disulfide reductase [Bacteroidia bacterium]